MIERLVATVVAVAAIAVLAGGRVLTAAAATPPPIGDPDGTGPSLPCLQDRFPMPAGLRAEGGRLLPLALEGHSVLVYLPGAERELPELRLPVVYFLHGSPGAAAQWITQGRMPTVLDSMIAADRLPPLIAVFPDEQGTTFGDSWWGDTALGDTVETWFAGDLVPAIDGRYCTLGAAFRGIAGLSAGGFGALNLAVRRLGMFSWVAGYSGVYSAPPEIFGAAAAANSPQLTVSSVPPAARFPLYLGGGAQDHLYLSETIRFTATVEALGWSPLRAEIVPGPHSWTAWSAEAHDSLLWLGQLWKDDLELPVLGKV